MFPSVAYPWDLQQWLLYNHRWKDAHGLPFIPTFPSTCPQYLLFLQPWPLERALGPARLKGAGGEQAPYLASGWRRIGVPSAPQLHSHLCTALVTTEDSWSPLSPPGCTGVSGLSSGSRSSIFFPLFLYVFMNRKVKVNGEEKQVLMKQLEGRRELFVSLRGLTFQW